MPARSPAHGLGLAGQRRNRSRRHHRRPVDLANLRLDAASESCLVMTAAPWTPVLLLVRLTGAASLNPGAEESVRGAPPHHGSHHHRCGGRRKGTWALQGFGLVDAGLLDLPLLAPFWADAYSTTAHLLVIRPLLKRAVHAASGIPPPSSRTAKRRLHCLWPLSSGLGLEGGSEVWSLLFFFDVPLRLRRAVMTEPFTLSSLGSIQLVVENWKEDGCLRNSPSPRRKAGGKANLSIEFWDWKGGKWKGGRCAERPAIV
ncbi:hypothetical protein QBC47DRAFT_58279 [Echria macrotheca]|uniref:Uncharacterized protein n=1 Tax=Echria macrotheca TaxID=438768 RepID=A0AAJ0B6A6_9PEZI|nr:hypothetical protein QBC47DRAFT_58279 [Echria macrotheca]